MLNIQKALKKIIERYIVKITDLRSNVSAGDTQINLISSRRYSSGEQIVLYNSNSNDAELHTIKSIIDNNIIELETATTSSYNTTAGKVQKIIGYESGNQSFIEAIYIGNPEVISRFPCITIDAKTRTSEWMTLESVKHTYDIDISIFVQAADYESQYEMMMAYVCAIEMALFRSFYPLVEPYDYTTISTYTSDSDTLLRVDDASQVQCVGGWIFLESYDYLRNNQIQEYMGNNVFRLAFPVGKEFYPGDKLIRPKVHVFNTMPHTTRYGTVNNNGMLKAAVISYRADVEQRLYTAFIDPLTF